MGVHRWYDGAIKRKQPKGRKAWYNMKTATHETHRAIENKNTIMGSLVTLGAYYHEECDRAMNKKDSERALEMIKLEDAVMTLLEDMQERFF